VAHLRLLQPPPLRLLFVPRQLLQRVPDRVRRRVRREERDEDELVAEGAQLLERERVRVLVPAEGRGVVERQLQVGMRLAHRAGERDRRLAQGVRHFLIYRALEVRQAIGWDAKEVERPEGSRQRDGNLADRRETSRLGRFRDSRRSVKRKSRRVPLRPQGNLDSLVAHRHADSEIDRH